MKTENRWKKIVHNCKVLKKLLHSPKAKKKNLTRQNCPTPPLSKIKWFIPYFILNSRNISKGCSRCHSMRPHEGRSACKSGYITGSRGDVFVVTTSKPVENIWNNGLFWSHWRSRYSFVTHSVYRKPRDWGLARSAYNINCRAPARLWLAVIDFQNGEQQSRSGSDGNEEIVYSRFIKIPLG